MIILVITLTILVISNLYFQKYPSFLFKQIFTILVKQYPQFWSTGIHNLGQQIYTILKHKYQQIWSTNIHNFEYLNINHMFDQTISTILVNKYPQFHQNIYTIWPNFDTGGVEVWSKFGLHLIEHLDFTMWFIHISIKLLPNFDIGGVGVWSKFGRRFYQNPTKLRHWCQNLGEVSTKFRNQKISTILFNMQLQLWPNSYHNFDQNISSILIKTHT